MLAYAVAMALLKYCVGEVGRWDVFTTQTAYPWSQHVSDPEANADYKITNGSLECIAATVYMVVRHGARYPTAGTTAKIEELRKTLLSMTNGPKYENVSNWESSYTQQNEALLTKFGENEQLGIGSRTGIRFFSLFLKYGRYTEFVSSIRDRNIKSTEKFYKGLQNVTNSIASLNNTISKTLMRFFDGCTIYEDQVEDSDEHMKEVIKYRDMDVDFLNVADKLTQQLGLDDKVSAGKRI